MTLRIAYVGPSISGRATSLASILNAVGVRSNPLTMSTGAAHSFRYAERDVEALISTARARLYYTDPNDPRLGLPVRAEVDWLCTADGFIFVADSQRLRLASNTDELTKLRRDLAACGVDLDRRPVVFQLNKRDLPDILETESLRCALTTRHCRYTESVAPQGLGTDLALLELLGMIASVVP